MPVSNISTLTDWSVNLGAARWIGRVSLWPIGPASSTGTPTTLRMRPSTAAPTGIEMGAPVFLTAWPRTRPSVESMATHRTMCSPRCCDTSTVRLSCWSLMALLLRRSAVVISGSSAESNATSTTGPMTWTTRPIEAGE